MTSQTPHPWMALDCAAELDRIETFIREQVLQTLRKRGAVVGISGGIDSAVVAAVLVRALGADRVLGLFMPETDTSDDALTLGQALAHQLGIETLTEPIAPALQALGCYARQADAIRTLVPEFGPGWKFKLVLPPLLDTDRLNLTQLLVQSPAGEQRSVRLTSSAYLAIVAATNYKQRVRKMVEYHHADRLNRAVAGTPNLLEYDQGFFVKQGDGAADFKPIAHLYKTQVYLLADHLGLPEAIRQRPPTTDTFSLPQTQEEFYFALPHRQMDLCLMAFNRGLSAADAAPHLGLSPEQVDRVYRDIQAKRRVAQYLHAAPALLPSAGPR
jgi:NAD+ synthase